MNLELRIMKIIGLLFFILYSLFFIPKAYAQSAISLGVYPPIFQIEAIPPANIQAPLSIENQGNEEINLKIELRPFKPSSQEDGQIKYILPEEANFKDPLILSRIQILENKIPVTNTILAPKQKKDLLFSLQIPKDEPPSDYYFSIIFLTNNRDSSLITNNSSLAGGIASNVLLSIGLKAKITGEIAQFSTPVFLDKGPVPFTIRVKNSNSFFITPVGDILIKNLFGQVVGKIEIPKTNILARSVRSLDSQDQSGAYWNEKFLLGPYKATLTLALSESGPIFRRDIFFFAFPTKIAFAVLVAAILIAYIYTRLRSKI